MSHHGNKDPKLAAAMHKAMRQVFGEYPNGKMNTDDAGAIAFAVGVETGRVVLRFPKPIEWVGFTADEAVELAETLVSNARKAGSKKPVVFRF